MRVLITSGTGNVGSRTTAPLLAAGVTPRVLSQSPEKLAALPPGVEGALGNFEDEESLRAALTGVDRVFLITPLHPDEAALGRRVIDCARVAGIERIVMLGVHRAEDAPAVPHFASKVAMEAALRESGIDWNVLAANVFFQNDLWYLDLLRDQGVYPFPLGDVGVSRVDVDDIAAAAVRLLATDDFVNRRFALVGPEVITGPETAATWGRHLGREVVYAGDVDAWGAQSAGLMPPWMVDDLVAMLRHFAVNGLEAQPGEEAALEDLLGRPPGRFEEFVAAHAG
ncbi:MAG: NmrA family NAD(P)-binding protein [Pseudomonadota bacterium]